MGPKKGKGSKLARMSEEERARYLQHRAAIEEEARRRKQQLISTFMKNKLKREEAFTRLNMAKINQQWRQILRDIKTQSLRQNLQNLCQSFLHVMERKGHTVNNLLLQLEEMEEMFCKATRFHSEIVDILIDLHRQRLTDLYEIYKTEKDSLLVKSFRLNKNITERIQSDQDYLATVTFRIENVFMLDKNITEHENIAKMDDVKNNMVIDIERLYYDEELVMENLWKDYYNVLSDYSQKTEPHRAQYGRLKERDAASSSTILEHGHRINALRDQTSALKSELMTIQLVHCQSIDSLNDQREQYGQYFTMLRDELSRTNKIDQNCLIKMNTESNNVIKTLEKLYGKAENILRLCSMCRKLETEQEKISPFQDIGTTEDKKENKIGLVEEPLAKEIFNYSKLGNFWERYNRAYLERIALELHYEALQMENQQLQCALKHYLSDVSKGTAAPSLNILPFLTTRPSTTNTIRKQPYVTVLPAVEGRVKTSKVTRPRPVTCIEATSSIAVQHMLRLRN